MVLEEENKKVLSYIVQSDVMNEPPLLSSTK
jgi:hypothetical protein